MEKIFLINSVVTEFYKSIYKEKEPPFEDVDSYKVSRELQRKLKAKGILTTLKKGKIVFDEKSYGINDVEHYWLEHRFSNKSISIDITAKKYQFYINETIPKIIIGKLPRYFKK